MSSVVTPDPRVMGALQVEYGESLQRTLIVVLASDASHMRPAESTAMVAVSTPLSRVIAADPARPDHSAYVPDPYWTDTSSDDVPL